MSHFVVRTIESGVQLCDTSKAIETKVYPLKGFQGPISSFVIVLQGQDNGNFWNHIRSKFGHSPPEFQIVVYQDDIVKGRVGFVLYEGDDLTKTKEAFIELESSLMPLLGEGTVTLTEDLLKEVILPKPLDKKSMIMHLVDVIESNPDAHPEWYTIIQLLQKKEPVSPSTEKSGAKGFFSTLKFKSKKAESAAVLKQKKSEESLETNCDEHDGGDINVDTSVTPKLEDFNYAKRKRKSAVEDFASLLIPFAAVPEGLKENDDDDVSEKVWLKYRRQTRLVKKERPSEEIRESKGEIFDSCDQEGKTPLMTAIEKGYIKSAFNFLLAGNNPNYQDNCSGNTALHIAVQIQNLVLVKMLLAFNAEPTIINKKGETSLDLARSNEACEIVEVLEKCAKLQAKTRDYFATHSSLPRRGKSRNSQFLLSLDGGGIRAFNTTQAIICIEDRLKQLDPKQRPFMSHFDYVAGTSAGSIAGSVLTYTDVDTRAGRYLIYKIITDVFDKKITQRGERIDQYLKDVLGEETTMGDLKGPQRMIITATLADRNPNKLHLMTSYGESRDGQLGPRHRKVWEACRISSTAPIFFPALDDKFLDGGLMANNPTLDAMVEIMDQNKKDGKPCKISCIVSLGNGIPKVKSVDNIEVFLPGFSMKAITSIPSSLKGLGSLFSHLVTQVTQSDGQEVYRARILCDSLGSSYFRVSPPLSENIDPLSTDREAIVNMIYNTQMYLLDIPDQIDAIAKCLLSK